MQFQTLTAGNGFALSYSGGRMGLQTALDRFLLRVNALLEERDMNQKDLRGARSEGWISNILRGDRNLKLNDAAEIAERLGVPLAELVRRPDDTVYELDNLEARVIEAFRQMSKDEQQAVVTLVTMRHRPGMAPLFREKVPRLHAPAPSSHERRALSSRLSPETEAAITLAVDTFAEDLRRQAASASTKVPQSRETSRSTGGSAAPKK